MSANQSTKSLKSETLALKLKLASSVPKGASDFLKSTEAKMRDESVETLEHHKILLIEQRALVYSSPSMWVRTFAAMTGLIILPYLLFGLGSASNKPQSDVVSFASIIPLRVVPTNAELKTVETKSRKLQSDFESLVTSRNATAEQTNDFMFYSYLTIREQFASLLTQFGKAKDKVHFARDRINQHLEYAKDKKSDTDIIGLYQNLLAMIDLMSDSVHKITELENDVLDVGERQASATAMSATESLVGKMQNGAVKDAWTGLAAVTFTGLKFVIDSEHNKRSRDRTMQLRLDSILDQHQQKMSVLDARETVRLNAISQKNKWQKITSQWGDPLSILQEKIVNKYKSADTVEKAIDVSNDILQTLKEIPDSAIFDFHRSFILSAAASLAGWAADQENPEWRKGKSSAAGNLAERICQKASSLHALDLKEDQSMKMLEVRILAANGKLQEAINQAVLIPDYLSYGCYKTELVLKQANACSSELDFRSAAATRPAGLV